MNADMRADLIRKVEVEEGNRKEVLESLNIPRSTYYKWRRAYDKHGIQGLERMKNVSNGSWNRLRPDEEERVLRIARLHPELSPRLLSVKITDENSFSVSESTVYRILKKYDLIAPRPLPEMPAAKEWRHKTTRPDEIWQCDATNIFVVGWGYYKLIPAQDDFSRKVVSHKVKPDETAGTFSDVVEKGIENARAEGHLMNGHPMPKLYTDNGPGFISGVMENYLATRGIKHILGTPYHPQGRGKIERLNRTLKGPICLLVYCSPDELVKAADEAVKRYNATPHEALDNVSPNDVYAGRKEAILKARQEKKRLTIERRKAYNLGLKAKQNNDPNQHQSAN